MKVAIGVQRQRDDGIRLQHADDILELRVLPGECLSDLWIVAEGLEVCRMPLYMREAKRPEEPHEQWVREYAESHDLGDFGPGITEALTTAYLAGKAQSVEVPLCCDGNPLGEECRVCADRPSTPSETPDKM